MVWELGVSYKDKGRLDEAITGFERALALKSRYADADYNLAVIYGVKGIIPKEVKKYQKPPFSDPMIIVV